MDITQSERLFQDALKLFPGGVNSPVRAFKSVGGKPIFLKKGKGSRIWDEDNNQYLDFCCSWGPLILGHAHPDIVTTLHEVAQNGTSFGTPTQHENRLGNLICKNHRLVDKIRFVSSGTEATMSACRLARGYTGKNKIVKFEGCFHGHVDGLLVKAGSGLATLGTSSSAGVPEAYAKETLVIPLNDTDAVDKVFKDFGDDIAAVIIEPIPANNGLLVQSKAFHDHLRSSCTKNNVLLIFDEVISGFRVGFEGAAGKYQVEPDLFAFGKVIGGGLPVGAYGGKQEIMDHVAPLGDVYQAGTLSGNPMAMAAGFTQLSECLQPGFYERLETKTNKLVEGLTAHANEKGYPFRIFNQGSIFWLSFDNQKPVLASSDIDPDMSRFAKFHHFLLEQGVYLGPSGYEVGFVSAAHSNDDIEFAIVKMSAALDVAYG